eukprot:gnl/MRDRNA2_/MRDRNA2_131035_c0_seq1.p1 gnl/MRDRNA2_/MRDRNA2_131035_c0~~gnl/MRDRNA2_/MRDRNA2_131035_c0_seq1.p1  ORF type:complete len:260 (-),score=41.91 gnl/MRDRNA2_/MRDRNA2_131035_c0_seq1:102-818(-)
MPGQANLISKGGGRKEEEPSTPKFKFNELWMKVGENVCDQILCKMEEKASAGPAAYYDEFLTLTSALGQLDAPLGNVGSCGKATETECASRFEDVSREGVVLCEWWYGKCASMTHKCCCGEGCGEAKAPGEVSVPKMIVNELWFKVGEDNLCDQILCKMEEKADAGPEGYNQDFALLTSLVSAPLEHVARCEEASSGECSHRFQDVSRESVVLCEWWNGKCAEWKMKQSCACPKGVML